MHPVIVIIAASAILYGLYFYLKYLIKQYGKHIRTGCNRAKDIRLKIKSLTEIYFLDNIDSIKNNT
jgi:hypothetical protein